MDGVCGKCKIDYGDCDVPECSQCKRKFCTEECYIYDMVDGKCDGPDCAPAVQIEVGEGTVEVDRGKVAYVEATIRKFDAMYKGWKTVVSEMEHETSSELIRESFFPAMQDLKRVWMDGETPTEEFEPCGTMKFVMSGHFSSEGATRLPVTKFSRKRGAEDKEGPEEPPAKVQRGNLPPDYVKAVLRGIVTSAAPPMSCSMKEGPTNAAESAIAALAHASRVANEALEKLESADPASTAIPPRRALRVCFNCEKWGCTAHESDGEEEEEEKKDGDSFRHAASTVRKYWMC